MNFLTEHGITVYAGLETKVTEMVAASDEVAAALKGVEKRLADVAVMVKHITTHKQTKPMADDYHRTKVKPWYRREHESALILYEAATRTLKENGVTKLPDLPAPKAEYERMDYEKERLYTKYGEAKKAMKKYGIIKQNVGSVLRGTAEQVRTLEL